MDKGDSYCMIYFFVAHISFVVHRGTTGLKHQTTITKAIHCIKTISLKYHGAWKHSLYTISPAKV
jgi:hypothetical protein